MLHKIGLEEHFSIPETKEIFWWYKDIADVFQARIEDLTHSRIEQMDEYGMDMMIISLNSPAIQGIYNRKEAVQVAKTGCFLPRIIPLRKSATRATGLTRVR